MISFGKNITSANDPLLKISMEKFFHAIKSPKAETIAMMRQLRTVRELDAKQYTILKRQLPYVVAGIFNPGFRKIENFAYTEYFIVDIDKIEEKHLSIDLLKIELKKNNQVFMLFTSPSCDGLKVVFKLSERCYDAGLYSLFYKTFVHKFAIQYNIQQVVDKQTSDVSRACFISIDPDVYYNPNCDKVEIRTYLDLDNPFAIFENKRLLEQQDKELEKEQEKPKTDKLDIDDESFQKIKSILNPKLSKLPSKPPAYVPQELENIMSNLVEYLNTSGVIIEKLISIQYGKKLQLKVENKVAEINLFYGKKGYSVVKSPRTGTNETLNDLMLELVQQFINMNING